MLITAKTEADHLKALEEVLKRMARVGLRVKKPKCKFMAASVEYLGYLIDEHGLRPLQDKIRAIRDAPTPTNVTELKSYLGLLSYYGKFLSNFSSRLAPLLSVIKARFSCILVNFTCRFEDSPSVPERSYEQSVDILGYYYASISHVSTNYPLNFYTLSIDNSFMKVLKNAKSEMPTMFHSILPSKLPMGRMLLQCPNTSMKG